MPYFVLLHVPGNTAKQNKTCEYMNIYLLSWLTIYTDLLNMDCFGAMFVQ